MVRKIFFLAAVILLLAQISSAEDFKLQKIEAKRSHGFDYLDIYTSGYVVAKGLLLEDRLVIDLPGMKIAKGFELSRRKSKRIKAIDVEQADPQTVRITVSLTKGIDYDIANIFGKNKSVVEICDRVDEGEKIMSAWEKANLREKGETLKPFKYAPLPKLADVPQPLRGKVIVLDPGHGGKDPGAISISGIPEKVLTLQAAQKAAQLLRETGATVYLTRNSDRKNSLRDIVEFANKIDADILISLHYNYNGDRSIAGTETYYYNSCSRALALSMHQSLIAGINRKDRGLRRAMFYLCHHSRMPAVLIEPLYLSNGEEDGLAKETSFQVKLAQDILRGVRAYFRSRGN